MLSPVTFPRRQPKTDLNLSQSEIISTKLPPMPEENARPGALELVCISMLNYIFTATANVGAEISI